MTDLLRKSLVFGAAALLSLALAAVGPAWAQAPAPETPPQTSFPSVLNVTVPAGTGRLLQLPAPAATVMAADPRVARVQPASPTTMFVMAVTPGRTNIIATDERGRPIIEYNVVVTPAQTNGAQTNGAAAPTPGAPRQLPRGAASADIAQLQALLRRSVPGAQNVRLEPVGGRVLLSGTVPTAEDARRVLAVVGTALGDATVVNDLSVLSALTVNVRVRVAEVSRQITRELGFNWSALGSIGRFGIGLAAGLATDPETIRSVNPRAGVASFGYRGAFDVNGLIDALAADQLISILAEPNLTALSGETASFLAGGEFPVPLPGGQGQLGVEFRQFGVSLSFVPTVLGPDRLNLRIRPEVSELSDAGAVNIPFLGGTLRIPALTVRRAETTVELGSGQSFAIAGLLQRSINQVGDGPLGLSEIPILGPLFRSDRFRRNETELVIIVTPYIVVPVSDPRALRMPFDGYRPPNDLERILQMRQTVPLPAGLQVPRNAGFILE